MSLTICQCYWCEQYASVEGYCRDCFLFCMDEEPKLDHELLMRTHRSLVSLYNWNKHRIRQRRSDLLIREEAESERLFAAICPRLPKPTR